MFLKQELHSIIGYFVGSTEPILPGHLNIKSKSLLLFVAMLETVKKAEMMQSRSTITLRLHAHLLTGSENCR